MAHALLYTRVSFEADAMLCINVTLTCMLHWHINFTYFDDMSVSRFDFDSTVSLKEEDVY